MSSPSNAPHPLIELASVTRVFQTEGHAVPALVDISLRIDSGEFVCVTGPSGAGKSSLLHILGCLDRPTNGTYRINGTDIGRADDDALAGLRRRIGFVFQGYNLIDQLSAHRNVELAARYGGLPAPIGARRAADLLAAFEMGDRMDHRPTELSGGEQQRVAIARALANGSQVILADEPTGALDVEQGTEILALLEDLAQRGHAVVIASHDRAVAERAGRRIEMVDGRIVNDTGRDSPHTLKGTPNKAAQTPASATSSGPSTALREGLAGLWAKWPRTIGTIISVTLAVGAATTVLGITAGAMQQTAEIIARHGADRIAVYSTETPPAPVRFGAADAHAIATGVDNVRATNAHFSATTMVQRGDAGMVTLALADTYARPRTFESPWMLAEGRFLGPADNERREPVVLLGPTLRHELFDAGEDPIGQSVQVETVPLRVVGVLAEHPPVPGIPTEHLELYLKDRGNRLFIPFGTALGTGIFDESMTPSVSLDVWVDDVAKIEDTASAVRDMLIRRHGRDGFGLDIARQSAEAFAEARSLHPAVLAGVAIVALVAGGFGVMGFMLAAVNERRREIGIRMAIGARRRDILAQFLAEALLMCLTGAALGLSCALFVEPIIGGFLGARTAFEPWFVPVALGCGIISGLVFGCVPAMRAAHLDPVAALASD